MGLGVDGQGRRADALYGRRWRATQAGPSPRNLGRVAELIVESFLVSDHRVTAWDAHVERFRGAVAAHLGQDLAGQVDALVAGLASELPHGRRFPRLEARPDGLTWVDRESPPHRALLRVAAEGVPDTRKHPSTKGPDLDLLQRLRAPAQGRGADDVLLVRDGQVVETTTTTILLRRDDDYVTAAEAGLPSTTLAWLSGTGVPIESVPLSVADVLDAATAGDAFALNALHGPRLLVTTERLTHSAMQHGLAQVVAWREQWLAAAELLS